MNAAANAMATGLHNLDDVPAGFVESVDAKKSSLSTGMRGQDNGMARPAVESLIPPVSPQWNLPHRPRTAMSPELPVIVSNSHQSRRNSLAHKSPRPMPGISRALPSVRRPSTDSRTTGITNNNSGIQASQRTLKGGIAKARTKVNKNGARLLEVVNQSQKLRDAAERMFAEFMEASATLANNIVALAEDNDELLERVEELEKMGHEYEEMEQSHDEE
jgi:hypothetical protein